MEKSYKSQIQKDFKHNFSESATLPLKRVYLYEKSLYCCVLPPFP